MDAFTVKNNSYADPYVRLCGSITAESGPMECTMLVEKNSAQAFGVSMQNVGEDADAGHSSFRTFQHTQSHTPSAKRTSEHCISVITTCVCVLCACRSFSSFPPQSIIVQN